MSPRVLLMAPENDHLLRRAESLWRGRGVHARTIPYALGIATLAPVAVHFLRIPCEWTWFFFGAAFLAAAVAFVLNSRRRTRDRSPIALLVAVAFGWAGLAVRGIAVPTAVAALLGLTPSEVVGLYWHDDLGATLAVHGRSWNREVRGEILTVENRADGSARVVLSPATHDLGKMALRACEKTGDLRPGRRLAAQASLGVPATTDNPGGFSYRRYLARQGVYLTGDLTSVSRVDDPAGFLAWARYRLYLLRDRLAAGFSLVPEPERSLLAALSFGQRERIPSDLEDSFRNLGIYHYLSVSGLHVSIVAAFLGLVTKTIGMGREAAKAGALFGAWGFAILSGLAVPALRSVLMLSLGLLSLRHGRRRRSLRGLCIAALVVLTANPLLVFDTGFQLSFAATAGVLLAVAGLPGAGSQDLPRARLPRTLHRIGRGLAGSVAISLGAQLAILPLLLRYFGGLALFGPIHTLVLMPAVSAALVAGLLVGGAGAVFGELPSIVQQIATLPVTGILRYVDWANRLPVQFASLGDPGVAVGLALAGGSIACAFLWISRRHLPYRLSVWRTGQAVRATLAFATLTFLVFGYAGVVSPSPGGTLSVTFLSVGEGASALIRSPSGLAVLVDGGGRAFVRPGDVSAFDVGRDVVVPYLRNSGVTKLDAVIATHDHADHVQGLQAVFRSEPVDYLIEPCLDVSAERGKGSGSGTKSVAKGGASSLFAPRKLQLEAGDILRLRDGVEFEILNPVPGVTARMDANNSSLVFRLKFRAFRLLMAADLETDGIEEIRRAWPQGGQAPENRGSTWRFPGNWRSEVMMIPHHGSGGPGHEELIDAVDPRVAIISVGKNRFGHPNAELIRLLSREGRKVLRTDVDGAVYMETDGVRYRVRPLRGSASPWMSAGDPEASL